MSDREGDDPLLDHRRQLVGHLRPTPLPRPQHLQPVPVDQTLPAVESRAVHTERAAGLADGGAGGVVEQLQPVAEEDVILRHAAHSFPPIGRRRRG